MTPAEPAEEQSAEPSNEQDAPTPENQQAEPAPMPQPAAPQAPSASQELAAAKTRIAELEKKLLETKDQALRALAEADNTRKRAERAKEDTAKFAVSSFARDMLSIADNLRRALAAMTPEMREKNPELVNMHTGISAVERELIRVFENNGVKRIDPINEKFDANHHEVMFEVPTPHQPPGTVVQVIDPGYLIHERLLRPARVGVAKSPDEDSAPQQGGNLDQQV
jgi:molecular chaperone GrpE